jgi:hypothetical protein
MYVEQRVNLMSCRALAAIAEELFSLFILFDTRCGRERAAVWRRRVALG